jgi:hypothetical protein
MWQTLTKRLLANAQSLIWFVYPTEDIYPFNVFLYIPLTGSQPYHTDLVCDVVATLTKSCGSSGGAPALASAFTVYNAIASTRPDLIPVLSEPNWPFDT